MSIIKKINEYYNNIKDKKNILFTTPSHSQGEFVIPELENIIGKTYLKNDFSEIDGFDNLRKPSGIIKKLLNKISYIYNTKASFVLTNGSTSGILAIMLATLKENDEVLIARNCHVSVYNGLVLSGAKPIWFMPEYNEEWGIFNGVTSKQISKLVNLHKNLKALIITSPTYEGVFSDIKEISDICKKNYILLIVDEAHGALLNFSEYKEFSAINCNADACIHSLHKNAGAPNPCALLHIPKHSSVDINKVQNALNLINTTSPSYPLMAAIEATIDYLNSKNGQKHIKSLIDYIKLFSKSLNPNVKILNNNNDITKILIRINGYTGCEIADIINKNSIEEEYSNETSSLFLTGIGTTEKKLNLLKEVLNKIPQKISQNKRKNNLMLSIPEIKFTPKKAYLIKDINAKTIDIDEALNKISAEDYTAYPPGIPIIMPGEIINQKTIDLVKNDKYKKNKIKIISD